MYRCVYSCFKIAVSANNGPLKFEHVFILVSKYVKHESYEKYLQTCMTYFNALAVYSTKIK